MSRDADLSYLREMAEAGERAPILSGRFFVWWGSLASMALMAHWFILTGRAGMPIEQVGLVWLTFGVVGSIGSVVLRRGMSVKPGAGSAGNRGDRAVWNAMFISIVAYTLGLVAALSMGRIEQTLFDTIPLFSLASYGIAFTTVAALGGPRWMKTMAWISWILCAIGTSFIGTAVLYLFCVVSVLLVAVVPGVLLLRAEPSAKS